MPATALHEFAPAKINLALHILGRRTDGYHDLESLVAFASVGDRLTLVPGEKLTLTITGPMAAGLTNDGDNLILKVARALAARKPGLKSGAFTLEKNLPVASGIGGGSADAAAALRLLAKANGISLADSDLMTVARETGADVSVCVESKARIMRGVGEALDVPLTLLPLPAVLINPGIGVATAAVFQALALEKGASFRPERTPALPEMPRFDHVVELLQSCRNDLEAPAISLEPIIKTMLGALSATPHCRLGRMSGSGATVFGLYPDMGAADNAAMLLAKSHPDWWIMSTQFR